MEIVPVPPEGFIRAVQEDSHSLFDMEILERRPVPFFVNIGCFSDGMCKQQGEHTNMLTCGCVPQGHQKTVTHLRVSLEGKPFEAGDEVSVLFHGYGPEYALFRWKGAHSDPVPVDMEKKTVRVGDETIVQGGGPVRLLPLEMWGVQVECSESLRGRKLKVELLGPWLRPEF